MNFDEYQNTQFLIYQSFAETVRFILEQALKADRELPRPQSIQSRAKSLDSLRRRLMEQSKLDTQTLETDRCDLAGTRLIFYTNNDVDRFLGSSIVRENFDIEEDSTKVHQPRPENQGAKYRAIHYTVRLREDRTRLPEYQRFAGLRCEIQVQTILNHAYSETSHDILYKNEIAADGYGKRAMLSIARRFERIMDEHLIPAGYEIQKAQQEYERLLQGKELFDKKIGALLENAKNNNERHEILSRLKDYALPNYDDLVEAFQGLKVPLITTVKRAIVTERVPIETTFGNLDGFKAETVIGLVIDIVERLRYKDVTGTLQLLIDIFREVTDERIRARVLNVVKSLAEYNLDAYRQVGFGIQTVLVEYLEAMSDAGVDSVRPIAIAVWREAIQSEITGTRWRADSVALRAGAVPVSEQLKEVRDKAIKALFAAYDRSTDDMQRRDIFSALNAATRTSTRGNYSNELLATTVKDTKRIVAFAKDRAKAMSFALLQHLEHRFLYDYFRAMGLVADTENRFGCQSEARELEAAILEFRDVVNADTRFVRYKVLVGFESVYPQHWADRQFDYSHSEEHRRAEADRYIEEVNAANEAEWSDLIEECAATKSNDGATFPFFGKFISNLAERKPEVAARLLTKASDNLRLFLAGFLNGFLRSGRRDMHDQVLAVELLSVKNLAGVARHIRYAEIALPHDADAALARSIETDNIPAVVECLLFAMEHYDAEKIVEPGEFVGRALDFLNKHKNASWVWHAWYLQNVEKFYDALTAVRLGQLLESLGYLPKIDYQAEAILARLARRWREQIWDYFGQRLTTSIEAGEDEDRFEAVPFEFHELHKELSKDAQLGIKKGLAWFKQDNKFFQFRGGRVLGNAFPGCTPEFAKGLADLIREGGETEADFALDIFQNYKGENSTHVVLKEIVSKFSGEKRRMTGVAICIDNTGVVSGELGFAEAWRAKRDALGEWVTDERSAVREFAEKHIRALDLQIADEHRRAEASKEMFNRDFDDADDAGESCDDAIEEL